MMRSRAISWRFLTIISLYFTTIMSLSSQQVCAKGRCLSDQKSLLLELKNTLIFDTFPSEDNPLLWNPSTDCCTWEGVSCQDGRVVGLHLSNKLIVGGLKDNSSLFHFQHLKTLDLSLNYFDAPIPSRFGNLTTLTHLNLSGSHFVGKIPIEISRLANLVTLDLSTAESDETQLKVDHSNWSKLFRNLTKLQQLHLDGVELFAPVPRFIANFSALTSLRLGGCGLYGTFPKEIFQVKTLETIDLSSNEFLQGSLPEFSLSNSLQNLVLSETSFSGTLPTSIGNLTKLSTLDLSLCQFNGTLPNFMLPELVELDLSQNKFVGPIPSFKFSKNLVTISLSQNGLSGAIPSAHLEGLPKLVLFDLGYNSFNGSLPTSLFRVPLLENIFLSNNQFNGQIPEFSNVSSSMLWYIDLSNNNLEGPIPMSMFQLKNLWFLSLSFNNLNGTLQLDVVKGLVKLTHLDLSYNNLSIDANDTAWSSFPKGIDTLILASCNLNIIPNLKNQPNLSYLDLSNNQIHGVIPNWIWDLGNGGLSFLNLSHNYLVGIQVPHALPFSLKTLDLHFNQIRGKMPKIPHFVQHIDFSSNDFYSSIPANIGNNIPLNTFLSLSYNGLTGVIPSSICKMDALQVLDLSSNNFTGAIPKCIFAMISLLVLNLRGNSLNGIIPASFPVDCGLKTVDLNGNSIRGRIPKSLPRCTGLEVLDLGNNKLTDVFPCFLGIISTLRVLILRSNKFHGSMGCSHAKTTLAKLQILDLAHNSFSGELPGHDLTNWKEMISKEDDAQRKLGHLRIELIYPSYYEDSTTLTIKGQEVHLVRILTIDICIDLSSNNFSGRIPEELGALTLLYVLNLSNNAFSGSIPWSLGELRSLESLDLSRNKLSGTIPTSLADLNFLSLLDLSFNKLVGMIPSGHQIQTFSANSFRGNQGLWGCPLTTSCTNGGAPPNPSTLDHDNQILDSETRIDWNILSAEIGFIVGFGSFIGALVFCKRWRKLYFETMEEAAYRILPLAVTRKWISWTISR